MEQLLAINNSWLFIILESFLASVIYHLSSILFSFHLVYFCSNTLKKTFPIMHHFRVHNHDWEQFLRYYCITHYIMYHRKAWGSISDKCLCVVILTVILSSEYFRGDVIGGAAESARCIAWSQTLLWKIKRSSSAGRLSPMAINWHLSSSQVLLSKVHFGYMRPQITH